MNPKFSLQYQYLSAWLILLAIKFSFHPNPMGLYQQMTKVQYDNATKTQLMRGATPPTNQIQAATSSWYSSKKIKKMKLKPTQTQSWAR